MKFWKKPIVIEATVEKLFSYITVAARSGGMCASGHFR